MNKAHAERIKQERGSSATSFVYIPCFPLLTILKAMNVQKIDYFSLDVEGLKFNNFVMILKQDF